MDNINEPTFLREFFPEKYLKIIEMDQEETQICIYYDPLPVSQVWNIEQHLSWDIYETSTGSSNFGENCQVGN